MPNTAHIDPETLEIQTKTNGAITRREDNRDGTRRHEMDNQAKAKKLRDAMLAVAKELFKEGNKSAAELTMSACREMNTLKDSDAARLYDLIRSA